MSATVEVRGLELRYGYRAALQGITFEARRGECVLIVGQNGAGKSTLLKILATLARPTGGSARILGASVVESGAEVRQRLGYLGHEPQVYPGLTAVENLKFAARLHGRTGAERDSIEKLKPVGLELVALQPARSYSRGMLQRLALARTLLHEPEVLLLDEPFTGLDVEGRATCLRLLDAVRARGCTVLLTTHQLEEVHASSTKILVLGRGRLLVQEEPRNLTQEAIAQLLGGRVSE